MTRKYNGQKKRGKNTNNGSHNTTEKFEQYETPLKKTEYALEGKQFMLLCYILDRD